MLSNEWILNNKISGIKLVFFSLSLFTQRLCNLAGTEWALPEDDAFALKYVGAINKEQYNKNCQSSVHLFVHCIHSIDSISLLRPIFKIPHHNNVYHSGFTNISYASHKSNLSSVPKGYTVILTLGNVEGGNRCGKYTLYRVTTTHAG